MDWLEINGVSSEDLLGDKVVFTKRGVKAPQVKNNIVEVPYSNITVDYSFLNGVCYSNREFFIGVNIEGRDYSEVLENYSILCQWIAGKGTNKIRMSDYWGVYFIGRVEEIGELDNKGVCGNFDFKLSCEPWIYNDKETIIERKIVHGESLELIGSYMPEVPEITSSKTCNISFNGKTIKIYAGTNKYYDLTLKNGINIITLLGSVDVEFKIRYRTGGI